MKKKTEGEVCSGEGNRRWRLDIYMCRDWRLDPTKNGLAASWRAEGDWVPAEPIANRETADPPPLTQPENLKRHYDRRSPLWLTARD